MVEHIELSDIPEFCIEIEKWLKARYGEEEGNKLWELINRQYDKYLEDLPDYSGRKTSHALAIYGSIVIFSMYPLLPDHPPVEELQELVYKVYDEFMTVYQRLIPALTIQYCKDDSFDFEHEGSATSSFDSVKQFYLDAYEALGNLMIIPVALNNIKYRSDINAMNLIEKNVNSLEDYIKLTKASRYHFCVDSEVYTGFLKILVNAKLRNAIGHNDVEYNSVDQLITYIPNPKDRTKKRTEYLLEFENEAMRMFQGILGISEYLYRLRELALMHDGKIPLMVQERANWHKKIGRNEPCPCGSGKKYKHCHGK